jgi:NDP-sugar pyrophosphorylase family protein
MKVTDAVVLAGGLGTRIRDTLGDLPKALADIHGKTLLARKLDELRANEISRVHILTGIGHAQVSEFLADYRQEHPHFQIIEQFDGDQPLGTGGAVFKVLPTLPQYFFLTYGDSLLSLDYNLLEAAVEVTGLPHAISATTRPGPSDQLNCQVNNQRLIRYDKSGGSQMNSTDYGMLLFSRDPLNAEMATEMAPFDLAPIISRLADLGQLSAVLTDERYLEVGTPRGLIEVRDYFQTVLE